MRILIVDDTADSRHLISTLLARGGYNDVTAVGSAREAFETLAIRVLCLVGVGTGCAMGLLLHAKSTGEFGARALTRFLSLATHQSLIHAAPAPLDSDAVDQLRWNACAFDPC